MRALVVAMFILLVGCNKTSRPLLQLEMYGDDQTALYIVAPNGTIEFGGGIDALAGKTTWQGELTNAQLSKLNELLRTEQLHSVSETLTKRYEITVLQMDEIHRYVLPLSDSSAAELYFFLEEATLERIQVYLDALPKPSMDVITDRKVKGSNN